MHREKTAYLVFELLLIRRLIQVARESGQTLLMRQSELGRFASASTTPLDLSSFAMTRSWFCSTALLKSGIRSLTFRFVDLSSDRFRKETEVALRQTLFDQPL